ncbi:hypothetical protein CJ419_10015 [Vibrio navarrensis]|nr:hypothetical protein [Vibrio navarrensis]
MRKSINPAVLAASTKRKDLEFLSLVIAEITNMTEISTGVVRLSSVVSSLFGITQLRDGTVVLGIPHGELWSSFKAIDWCGFSYNKCGYHSLLLNYRINVKRFVKLRSRRGNIDKPETSVIMLGIELPLLPKIYRCISQSESLVLTAINSCGYEVSIEERILLAHNHSANHWVTE